MTDDMVKTGASNELVCFAAYPRPMSEFMSAIHERDDEIRGLKRLLAAGLSGVPRQTARKEFKAYRKIQLVDIPPGWRPSNV